MNRRFLPLLLLAALPVTAAPEVKEVTPELRTKYHLPDAYKKIAFSGVFPVVGSDKPRDESLAEAAWLLDHTLGPRDDIRAALVRNRVRLAIMAVSEYTTDVPEHATLQPSTYWNVRARGLGASADRPAVSCGEENLIGCPGDPYWEENILIHEFAHAVHLTALHEVDPGFNDRLEKIYADAMAAGKWKGKYASTNPAEYWAEGVQSWFNCNRENDAEHNHVNTRAELVAYDPDLAALVGSVYTDHDWQYTPAKTRMDLPHLATLRSNPPPAFAWPAALLADYDSLTKPDRKATPGTKKWPRAELTPEKSGASKPGGKPCSFLLLNDRRDPVILRWVDFAGVPVMPSQIRPGFFDLRDTFVGHVWEVTRLDGTLIGSFRTREGFAKIEVSDPAP